MRTVSFSHGQVQNVLNNDFVCCYTNTEGDPSAGASFSHSPSDPPGPCGRGAGRQNVQTIFLTPQGEILHVATGFLDPQDLLEEAKFADGLFTEVKRRPEQGKQTVIAAHQQRLRQLGFSPQEIAADDGNNPLSNMLLSGPSPRDFGVDFPTPQDLGVNLAGPAGALFGDIARQRMLKDHQFVVANPLMSHETLQANPQALVGNHKSFFGSNSAMNGISSQFNNRQNPQRNPQQRSNRRQR